jgi:hypothetical protein
MYVFRYACSPSEANFHEDLGSDALQDEVNVVARLFRQQAPSMLNDEIRSRLSSSMNFTFQEEYLLDLILHEAVSSVVQYLTRNRAASRSEQTAQSNMIVPESDTHTSPPLRSETGPGPIIEHAEALQPLAGTSAPSSEYPEPSLTGRPPISYHFSNHGEAQMQMLSSQSRFDDLESIFSIQPIPPPGSFGWPSHGGVFADALVGTDVCKT